MTIAAILRTQGSDVLTLPRAASVAAAVALLAERRKARGDKPFAVMAGCVSDVEHLVRMGAEERRLLEGSERPVVLLRRRADPAYAQGAPRPADAVAPGSPDLGVMLPYTPVHHLLLLVHVPSLEIAILGGLRLAGAVAGTFGAEVVEVHEARLEGENFLHCMRPPAA